MPFVILNIDRSGSQALRAATRDAHIAYLDAHVGVILHGGPLLDEDGRPKGSLIVVDLPDLAAAEAFAVADPYAEAGLFETVTISGHRVIYTQGSRIA